GRGQYAGMMEAVKRNQAGASMGGWGGLRAASNASRPNELAKLLAVDFRARFAHHAPLTRLPNLARRAVERCPTAVAPAGGGAEVEDFAIALLGVSDRDALAREVRPSFLRFEQRPPQFVRRLFAHSEFGQVVGVGEDVVGRLVVRNARLDQLPVGVG